MNHIMNTVTVKNIRIIDAKDEYLIDDKNERYLDWFADVGTVNLGYRPYELSRMLATMPQHIPNTLRSSLKERASEMLCSITKMDKAFFCNSGSEANEAAIKIIRKWNKLNNKNAKTIYTFKGGFHGRTYGAVSAGDGASYHYEGFEPHLEGFKHFETLNEINWDDAQAVMMATMMGNNDAIVYSKKFYQELEYKCDIYNVPLVLDEVQVGAGRTGYFNGFDNYNIIPDVMMMGKGVACGIPTGVTLARGEFADIFTPGSHYSTFGGSPLSCAGIIHLIERYNDDRLLLKVISDGEKLADELSKFQNISGIRGVGLWIAFDVADNRAMELSDEMLKNKLFVPTFRKNAIKITPMLNNHSIEKGLDIISKSIKSVFGNV